MIRISRHARIQMEERGASELEVLEAIAKGEQMPAHSGRMKHRMNFRFGKQWGDKIYQTKQVVPVTIEERSDIIVITVYAFYF